MQGKVWSTLLLGHVCGEAVCKGETASARLTYGSPGMNAGSVDKSSLRSVKGRRRGLDALPGQATKTLRCVSSLRKSLLDSLVERGLSVTLSSLQSRTCHLLQHYGERHFYFLFSQQHGMGIPSLSFVLHRLTKLLHRAKCRDASVLLEA